MNDRIRRVGMALLVLFALLVGQLTYLQVVSADRLANHPGNVRQVIRDYAAPRGPILASGEEVLARSVEVDTEFRFRRRYPTDELFAHVAGYFSFTFGATGVEKEYHEALSGRLESIQLRNIGDLLIGKEPTGTVVLTLRQDIQETAREALAGRRGAVVALDPSTGAVLGMYSEPSFDPGPLASHDQTEVRDHWNRLTEQEGAPLLARAWREVYPPGSTFKIVTAAVALEQEKTSPDQSYPVRRELDLPLTDATIGNFGGASCGGSLVDSFRRSCNTTFAQIGLELGEDFIAGMHDFGIDEAPPLDEVPRAVAGNVPAEGSFEREAPRFAQAGIGQGPVAVTPLHMALVASAIANDGVIMRPHVMQEIRDVDGQVVERFDPERWRRAVSAETAEIVRSMMVEVVAAGTGTAAQIPGVQVAGKTGTAQTGGDNDPHAWFVAFAPADDPQVAVAVVVENGGELGSEATGGRVAAPVAKAVIEAVLAGGSPGESDDDG
ncbi:MAG TPA: penicillin-binding protein 2 [Acidimicrobiia bacterium]|nr:penicillin-binding protein 2 [Acidimicrobiia bacterium]